MEFSRISLFLAVSYHFQEPYLGEYLESREVVLYMVIMKSPFTPVNPFAVMDSPMPTAPLIRSHILYLRAPKHTPLRFLELMITI